MTTMMTMMRSESPRAATEPDVCVSVEPGDTLHRVAMRTAASVLIMDAGTGEEPPVVLLVWAFTVYRCCRRVPEA